MKSKVQVEGQKNGQTDKGRNEGCDEVFLSPGL
jgi:hypothetical protein